VSNRESKAGLAPQSCRGFPGQLLSHQTLGAEVTSLRSVKQEQLVTYKPFNRRN